MKRAENKSHCPVNIALEAVGDSWSLLIVRDIVFWGKRTYGDFLASSEHIATNVLAARLANLEQKGILTKAPHHTDRRREVYSLTEKGLDLIPVVLEMAGWAARYDSETAAPMDFVACAYADRYGVFAMVRKTVQAGGSIFAGPDSVVRQLAALQQTK